MIEQARKAAGTDWAQSAAAAAELNRRYPDNQTGYQLHLAALRALGHRDMAAAVLAEATTRFADQPWPLAEAVWAARDSGDPQTALKHAAELRRRFPDNPAGYQLGSATARGLGHLNEAAAILADGIARFPAQPWPIAEAAWLARARGDLAAASGHAAQLRADHPDRPHGYQLGTAIARDRGQFDEAAAILAEAVLRFPDQPWAASEAVLIAHARDDMMTALDLAARLRQRFPDNPTGYQIGASCARRLRHADTTAILTEAARRFPAHPWPLAEGAADAIQRGDYGAAADQAAELRRRFPNHPAGYRFGVQAERHAGNADAAAAILAEAIAAFPGVAWPLAESVALAEMRGDIDDALRRAGELRSRFPEEPKGYRLGAALLRHRGEPEQALAILAAATARFPSDAWPAEESAAIARSMENRANATRLLATLEAAPPAMLSGAPRRRTEESVIVMLGMHRAGTSLCAQLVERLGVSLGGPLMPPGADNPDGYQEHLDIVRCHEDLLKELGESWDTLRLVRPVPRGFWGSEAVISACTVLTELVAAELAAGRGRWAFKDPRTLRFLPLWQRVFAEVGVQPKWLLSMRDPRAVAASLLARNAMPPAIGALLWAEHYLTALRHLGPSITAILQYERWFSAPLAQLDQLAAAIGGATDDAREWAGRAIRSDLRHNVPSPGLSGLALADDIHARLTTEPRDLVALQHDAARLWREISALASGQTPA